MLPSDSRLPPDPTTSEKPEDQRDLMPTERKSMWRTAEERRLSDLTRVLEWLERRQGKKQQTPQACAALKASPGRLLQDRSNRGETEPDSRGKKKHAKAVEPPKAKTKEGKNAKLTQKQAKESHQVLFADKSSETNSRRDRDAVMYRRLYGAEAKGRRLSVVPGNYSKDGPRKSIADPEIKDSAAQESAQWSTPFHRQSLVDPMLQDAVFVGRKSTLLRDWIGKIPDPSYERKLKSRLEQGAEPRVETAKILKPEEVLSCRYLRLSKNNIRTLLKLCKDAGLAVDIHPHMVEAEIDSKKVFAPASAVAL